MKWIRLREIPTEDDTQYDSYFYNEMYIYIYIYIVHALHVCVCVCVCVCNAGIAFIPVFTNNLQHRESHRKQFKENIADMKKCQ